MPASAASNVPLTEEKRTLTVRGSRGGQRRHAADRTTQAALLVTTRGLFMIRTARLIYKSYIWILYILYIKCHMIASLYVAKRV